MKKLLIGILFLCTLLFTVNGAIACEKCSKIIEAAMAADNCTCVETCKCGCQNGEECTCNEEKCNCSDCSCKKHKFLFLKKRDCKCNTVKCTSCKEKCNCKNECTCENNCKCTEHKFLFIKRKQCNCKK